MKKNPLDKNDFLEILGKKRIFGLNFPVIDLIQTPTFSYLILRKQTMVRQAHHKFFDRLTTGLFPKSFNEAPI